MTLRTNFRNSLALTLLGMAGSLSACGGDSAATNGPSTVGSVSFATSDLSVGLGASTQVNAVVRRPDGDLISDASIVTWTSSNMAVATVDASGNIRGVALGGPATVSATAGGKSAKVSVTVTPYSVAITPAAPSLIVGQSVQLTATAYDFTGNVIPAATVTWGVAPTFIGSDITISPTGLLTPGGPGPFVVSAVIAGKKGTVTMGIASAYDGVWIGATTSSTQIAIRMDVTFGAITLFRLTSIPVQLCTTLQYTIPVSALISGGAFSAPSGLNQSAGTAGVIAGTFTSTGTMTGTTATYLYGQVICDDGQIQPGGHPLGPYSFSAVKQ